MYIKCNTQEAKHCNKYTQQDLVTYGASSLK